MRTRSERLKRWGVGFFLLNVPALLLKAYIMISHRPWHYNDPVWVADGFIALIGNVVGLSLLGISILIGGGDEDKRS